jgi:choline-sulfatase
MAAMSRRAIWVVVAALAMTAVALAAWRWRSGTSMAAVDGPIIFISIDTLRADRLPVYGSTRIKTPNIDALAAGGVVFEQAYAHSPQTLPSHTSILSGELPFEHGVRDNIGFTVKAGQRFLQHTLREQGYTTAAFVSSYVLRRQTGIAQGFETYDDDLPAASAATPLGQVQRPGEQTVTAAGRWIDAQPSARYFLFAHLFEPHTPYAAPSRFTAADPYDAEVAYADELVGNLLDRLRAKDLYDRATIVLFADHGEGLGDHGEDEHGIFLYRETIQVPLIIKLPRSREAGRRVTAPVQHIDLVPTVVALAGPAGDSAAAPPRGRGRSLLPLIEATGPLPAAQIYSESLSPGLHFGWSELYALSDGRHRYILAPRDELYDSARDPKELTSIAAQQPQVRNAMRRVLDGIRAGNDVRPAAAISDEDRRKLAALGYVGMPSRPKSTATTGVTAADPKDKIHVFQDYRRATQLVAARKFAEATTVYRALLREDPGMTDVWLQLAEAYQRQGRYPDALAAYQEVITRQPRDPAALTGAAGALLRTGRPAEARAHAELAVTVAPAVAHEMLARIALSNGDAAEARRHAQLAQQSDPTLPLPAFVEGMILYQQQRFDAAAARFLEVRKTAGGRTEQLADVSYLAGDSLARLERYEEAERLFEAELALTPDHVRARAGLAMLYQATGRHAHAAAAVDALVQRSPTPEGYEVAAQLWTMFGEPGKAAAARAGARRPPR